VLLAILLTGFNVKNLDHHPGQGINKEEANCHWISSFFATFNMSMIQ
jgi:oligoribonuclease NrnB/cAMP/cGMP phosphodiesterase (DHH superfamily)